MRVIAGSAKGKKLVAPRNIRPTTDRVKEALFSILGKVEGANILDLYAGSGGLGIEALSRGAKLAIFVDQNLTSVWALQKNLENLSFTKRAKIFKTSAKKALKLLSGDKLRFGLIFIDPPYKMNITKLKDVLDGLCWENLIEPGGIVVLEHSQKVDSITPESDLKKIFDRTYGDVCLTFYELRGENEKSNLSG